MTTDRDKINVTTPQITQGTFTNKIEAAEAQCPICGYYCLGHGGVGCIDKPSMMQELSRNLPEGNYDDDHI